MTPPSLDGAFARWLAARAGDLLMQIRAELGHDDPAALKAAGDMRSHDLLMTELARWRPDDAVLSEEGERFDPARLEAERVWIVDPLDGTREFAEEGRSDWAVHVALWSASAPKRRARGVEPGLIAGAVALPAQRRVLATDYPPGPVPTAQARGIRPRIAVSRTRPPSMVVRVADELGAVLVPMGSAGAKIAAVVTGEVDAYVHAGGQYEWDSAAPVAVAASVGLHTSRISGDPLTYNRADPMLPDLIVCRPELAKPLLSAIGVSPWDTAQDG
ncbi:3'(2'), 5'-bisphosphate nucleotidase [Allocatelliglobosispora scoriae]|uniref:3'(2'), 5'-bisphosphate nucleotidase n=2 Tax=Allocatelliglobosispora scoriae TaxID=643052 RepID=A0A841BU57_9ACTN|nr:3'(2'), 5'-bisphosphate nucleotidase [Allocatelliglobosispora scoriae]